MRKPLTRPTSAPTPIVTAITASIGHFATLTNANAVTLASAKFEPTLRSIPPASMTIVMPITISPNSPICRETSEMFPTVVKFGMAVARKIARATSRVTGMTLSIQLLPSTSPTT